MILCSNADYHTPFTVKRGLWYEKLLHGMRCQKQTLGEPLMIPAEAQIGKQISEGISSIKDGSLFPVG